MGKRLKHTPNSTIRTALRRLWLRSRERQARLKLDQYTCQCCGVKQSKAQGREVAVEVHHKSGLVENWDALFAAIRQHLLCDPDALETLCKKCHNEREQDAD